MANSVSQQSSKQEKPAQPVNKPNECGTISVQAHFKIYDPNSKKIFVEGRA